MCLEEARYLVAIIAIESVLPASGATSLSIQFESLECGDMGRRAWQHRGDVAM